MTLSSCHKDYVKHHLHISHIRRKLIYFRFLSKNYVTHISAVQYKFLVGKFTFFCHFDDYAALFSVSVFLMVNKLSFDDMIACVHIFRFVCLIFIPTLDLLITSFLHVAKKKLSVSVHTNAIISVVLFICLLIYYWKVGCASVTCTLSCFCSLITCPTENYVLVPFSSSSLAKMELCIQER